MGLDRFGFLSGEEDDDERTGTMLASSSIDESLFFLDDDKKPELTLSLPDELATEGDPNAFQLQVPQTPPAYDFSMPSQAQPQSQSQPALTLAQVLDAAKKASDLKETRETKATKATLPPMPIPSFAVGAGAGTGSLSASALISFLQYPMPAFLQPAMNGDQHSHSHSHLQRTEEKKPQQWQVGRPHGFQPFYFPYAKSKVLKTEFSAEDQEALRRELASLNSATQQKIFDVVLTLIIQCSGLHRKTLQKGGIKELRKQDHNPLDDIDSSLKAQLKKLYGFLYSIDGLFKQGARCSANFGKDNSQSVKFHKELYLLIESLSSIWAKVYQPSDGSLFEQLDNANVRQKCPLYFSDEMKGSPVGYVLDAIVDRAGGEVAAQFALFHQQKPRKITWSKERDRKAAPSLASSGGMFALGKRKREEKEEKPDYSDLDTLVEDPQFVHRLATVFKKKPHKLGDVMQAYSELHTLPSSFVPKR